MKTLTIGSTTFEINSCIRMRDLKRGFFLEIKIPQASISMDELCALLKDNEQTITITDGENVSAYNGFKMLANFSLEDGVYTVCQACTSEIEAQLSIAQNKVAEQAKALEATQQVVNQQAETITAQAETIAAQGETIELQGATIATHQMTIDEQAATVAEQGETISAQGETIATQQQKIEDQVNALAEQAENIATLEAVNAELKIMQETNDAELLYQVCLLQLGLTEEDL